MTDRIEKLFAYIDSQAGSPFVWGAHDCATFTKGCLDAQNAQYNLDKMPSYSNEAAAARIIKRRGGMEKIGDEVFIDAINPLLAQRGDVGLSKEGGFMVCIGAMFVGPGEHGLQMQSIIDAVKAWRVTCRN